MTALPPPPAHVEPYVRVLGPQKAFEFLMRFGGAELYLSATPKGRSEAETVVGAEKLAELAALDLPRRVPTSKPWLARMMKTQGLSQAEIARRLHTTDVTVRSWLNVRPVDDPRQRSLL